MRSKVWLVRMLRGIKGKTDWFTYRVEAKNPISHSDAMEIARQNNGQRWVPYTAVIPEEDRDDDEMSGWSYLL